MDASNQPPEGRNAGAHRQFGHVVALGFTERALHPYCTADGTELFTVARMKHPTWRELPDTVRDGILAKLGSLAPDDGGKIIRPMWRKGARYVVGRPTAPPEGWPLYGLGRVLESADDAPVFVVEGEACADALHRLGLAAVTSGGATSDDTADWRPLAGRRVILWPDHDDPGRKYAEHVGARLRGLQTACEWIDVAALGLPEKGDCVDWIKAHPEATAADVLALPRAVRTHCEAGERSNENDDGPPLPLPPALLPVQAFPLDAVPGAFGDWIGDAAERMQCPPDYIALPLVVAAGSLVARHGGVRPKQRDAWTEVPNLWGCIVGRPGAMKSPAIGEALFAMRRMEAQARETHERLLSSHTAETAAAKLRADARKDKARNELKKNAEADIANLLADDSPPLPPEPRLLVNDATVEALGEILANNPGGVLAVRDELASLLRNLAREEQATALGFMLSAWSGKEAYRWDRIGRGSVVVPCARVSVIGGTQPGPLCALVGEAKGAKDDGLLQRFLFAWPDVSPAWTDCDREPDRRTKDAVFALFARLRDAPPEAMQADTLPDGSHDGLPFLRFAPDAAELFLEWRAELETRLRASAMAPALEMAMSKYRKHVPALALTLHAAEGGRGPIGRKATLCALALAEYFESHTRRVFDSGQRPVIEAAHAVLRKLASGDLSAEGFTLRDVYRPQWTGLRETAVVGEALGLLCEHRHLNAEVLETGGRDTLAFSWRRAA